MRTCSLLLAVFPNVAALAAAQVTPYAPLGQEPDHGVPFPLPQELNAADS